jgi:hypothetical protein
MKSIEGIWEGIGEEILLSEGKYIEKIPLKLILEIIKVSGNTYIGKSQYFFTNGVLQFEETFLILRNGNEFISEDGSGLGINFYKFEEEFYILDLTKLTYKYNINQNTSQYNLNGEFVIYKR